MRVWLITIGEPVPFGDARPDRAYRTGYFSRYLAEHGHDVVWWTSAFDHFRKVHRFVKNASIEPMLRLSVRFMPSAGYRRNVSLARILDHGILARTLRTMARKEAAKPDIIVSALPTIGLCREAVAYGKEHRIPVVLDMRDMWPDIFVDLFPGILRPAVQLALMPMVREMRLACRGATAILGITEPFVDWGLDYAGRARTPWDKSFPMGYTSIPPETDRIREADAYWDHQGVSRESGHMVVCFLGTLGRQFDLETVINAARRLQERNAPITFVICGTGDRWDYYRNLASGLSHVIFPGWVNEAQIYALMRRASIGLDPLIDRMDFLLTLNNKAIEYLSAGVPILSSPKKGVLRDLIEEHRVGMSYDLGNDEELSNILFELSCDPERLATWSRNAKNLFEEQFVAEHVYGRMMEHLIRIANEFQRTTNPKAQGKNI